MIHTYRSYHTSIDPIPIPALVSMLSIFGSIGPPLPNTSALKFAPCITFTCPQIQGAKHLWHWLKHHLPIFRPHTLALPAIASTSSPLSSISSCPLRTHHSQSHLSSRISSSHFPLSWDPSLFVIYFLSFSEPPPLPIPCYLFHFSPSFFLLLSISPLSAMLFSFSFPSHLAYSLSPLPLCLTFSPACFSPVNNENCLLPWMDYGCAQGPQVVCLKAQRCQMKRPGPFSTCHGPSASITVPGENKQQQQTGAHGGVRERRTNGHMMEATGREREHTCIHLIDDSGSSVATALKRSPAPFLSLHLSFSRSLSSPFLPPVMYYECCLITQPQKFLIRAGTFICLLCISLPFSCMQNPSVIDLFIPWLCLAEIKQWADWTGTGARLMVNPRGRYAPMGGQTKW